MNELPIAKSYRFKVATVTAGLAGAGAVAGAVVGLAMTLLTGGFIGGSVALLLLNAAAIGALCGAVLFPAGVWTLMRLVPLGRAMFRTLLASAAGAALALGFFGLTAPVGVVGASAGFAVSAWRLRRKTREAL